MTVVIKRFSDKADIRELLGTLPELKRFDAHKFCGVLKLKNTPLLIQKALRDEWN
jgi:hypothetical protein